MKTLLVTGASKGIGFSIAKMFLEDGYTVVNLSRTRAPDDRIENLPVDLSLPEAGDQLQKLLTNRFDPGQICLVHNAAIMVNDTAADSDTATFRDVLNINVVGPHILNQLLIPVMQPGSSIIYIGSTLSEKAVPNTYSYVVSKHAMIGMMRATCQDLTGTGIHTTCICPGFTDTEMLRVHVGSDTAVLQDIASTSTFGRLIEPDEIAATVKFAAENAVINGAVLHANLGQIES